MSFLWWVDAQLQIYQCLCPSPWWSTCWQRHPGLSQPALGMAEICVLPWVSEDSTALSCFYLLLFCRKGTTEGNWPMVTECTYSPFLRIPASMSFSNICLFTSSSFHFLPQGHDSSNICADARKFSWCNQHADFCEEITENIF